MHAFESSYWQKGKVQGKTKYLTIFCYNVSAVGLFPDLSGLSNLGKGHDCVCAHVHVWWVPMGKFRQYRPHHCRDISRLRVRMFRISFPVCVEFSSLEKMKYGTK